MISTQLSTITESVQLSPPQASPSPISSSVPHSSVLDAPVSCPDATLYTTRQQTGRIVHYEQLSPTSVDLPSDGTPPIKLEYATIISPPHRQNIRTLSFLQSSSPSSSPSNFNSAYLGVSEVTSPTSHQNQLYSQHQNHRSELPQHQYSVQEPHFNFPTGREQFYKSESIDITHFDNQLHSHPDSAQYHPNSDFISVFEDPHPLTFITDDINDNNNNSSFSEPKTVSAKFTGGRTSPFDFELNRGKLPPFSAILPYSNSKSRVLESLMMMKTHESVSDESDDSGISSLEEDYQYTDLTNVPQPSHENVHCYGYDWNEPTILKQELDEIYNLEPDILFGESCPVFNMDSSSPESDECDSGSTYEVPFSKCCSFASPDICRAVIDVANIHEHESFLSSDGEVLEHMLPNFPEIQNPTESEVSVCVRTSALNRKKKRKIERELPSFVEKERRKPGRKPGQVSNVLHLWEFMRDLLHSSENQGIIEWLSKSEGVFKVINSTEVARLWGEKKKNKKKMTYEKLSRSIRYSRIEGYFADLPKDRNYPKKLCFKFGPKSKDWH